MSAPDTNQEKNKPAHKVPIYGMLAVVIFALVLLFGLVTWLSYNGNSPEEDGAVVNGIYKGVPQTEQAPQTGGESAQTPQSQAD